MILAIKTDQPEAYIGLVEAGRTVQEKRWLAGRQLSQQLLPEIEQLAGGWQKITGIVVYKGPGSFTGLRIGCSVANALAYGLKVPIVGESGSQWLNRGENRLSQGQTDGQVIPSYGSEPNISRPK